MAVSGVVTFDGAPLSEGNITLLPLDGGHSAGVEIRQGQFKFNRENGPSVGKYRVEIVAYRPTGQKVEDPDLPGQMMDETIQTIPERYNEQSELTIDITATATRDFEFALSL